MIMMPTVFENHDDVGGLKMTTNSLTHFGNICDDNHNNDDDDDFDFAQDTNCDDDAKFSLRQ